MVIEPSVSTTSCSSVKATDFRGAFRSVWSCVVGKKEDKVSHDLGLEHAIKRKKRKNSKVEKGLGCGRVQYNPNASAVVFRCSLMGARAV